MANEVRHPEEKTVAESTAPGTINSNSPFWQRYGKLIVYGLAGIILVAGAIIAYRQFVQLPNEIKASDAMWKAEYYYRNDSARLALNGDGPNPGFLKIISQYEGTDAANLSRFYAGASYMKLGDFNAAIKQLKEFSSDDKLIAVRAAGLLGDAYAETGKREEAVEQYRKAGTMFEEDNFNSPEYLFRAGLLYQELGKNKEAIEMYRIIKEKYSNSERGVEIDKYLARLGALD